MKITNITKRIKWKDNTSEITKTKTINRIFNMADAIERQFPEVLRSEQIKLKHMLFLKNAWFDNEGFAITTIADYTRAMRLMVKALDKNHHWFEPLKLVQDRQKGGRPAVSRVTRAKPKKTAGWAE
jgi:hypothetical protein